ncbi:MAG: hypothetical protein QOE70_2174 [Chthoniobacter sp.]|jgi:hypothetical protein|nr:hypothetical protein [Chthoniobacter sp.]
MNHSHFPSVSQRFAMLLALSTPLQAGDLLDAPGPGYYEQAARLQSSPAATGRVGGQLEPIGGQFSLRPQRSIDVTRSRPFSEALLSNRTLPELPRANPFEKPIRLFEPATP